MFTIPTFLFSVPTKKAIHTETSPHPYLIYVAPPLIPPTTSSLLCIWVLLLSATIHCNSYAWTCSLIHDNLCYIVEITSVSQTSLDAPCAVCWSGAWKSIHILVSTHLPFHFNLCNKNWQCREGSINRTTTYMTFYRYQIAT